MEYKRSHTVQDFSGEWNRLSECYFQQTDFLLHLEKYNPCKQRYHVCFEDNKPLAAAIVYSLPVNIFSFAGIKSVLQMQVIGVPCSVSCAGIFGSGKGVKALSEHIFSNEKGFVLMLNRKENPETNKYAAGKTLPTIVFHNHYSDWNEYVASLSAPYRRRLKKLTEDIDGLTFSTIPCSYFSETMHQLYVNVYEKSRAKLEKLNIDFFRNLPSEFQITACSFDKQIVGWNIALKDKDVFYFFLGGIDYRFNKTHNIYLRLLAQLVKSGIESKARIIELGQTAEIPKMRMGGRPQTLYMQAHHSNPILNAVLKMGSPLLEYGYKPENNKPFKTVAR